MSYIEKDLEDYICCNIEQFTEILENAICVADTQVNDVNIEFVGRQVKIGKGIADLVFKCSEVTYCWSEEEQEPVEKLVDTFFIVVELKKEMLMPSHYAQLTKYLNYLGEHYKCIGCLVGFDLDSNMQDIQISNKNVINQNFNNKSSNQYNYISFIKFEHTFLFNTINYSLRKEYIKEKLLDERLK